MHLPQSVAASAPVVPLVISTVNPVNHSTCPQIVTMSGGGSCGDYHRQPASGDGAVNGHPHSSASLALTHHYYNYYFYYNSWHIVYCLKVCVCVCMSVYLPDGAVP